jgi:hypothetical protein
MVGGKGAPDGTPSLVRSGKGRIYNSSPLRHHSSNKIRRIGESNDL